MLLLSRIAARPGCEPRTSQPECQLVNQPYSGCSLFAVHCRSAVTDWASWFHSAPLRRRHADIRLLPTVCISWSADAFVCMHRRGCGVDAFQSVTAEYCEDRASLVHNQPPSSSAAAVTAPGRLREYFASFCRSRPWNIHRQRCLDEVLRRENGIGLLLRTASTADYPSVSVEIC